MEKLGGDYLLGMHHAFPQSGYRPPEKADPRNFDLAKAQPIQPYPASFHTDLSAFIPFFQGQLSDCVENAITFVKKYHEYKNTNQVPDLSRRSLVIPTVIMDGFPLSEGTSVQNALYVAHKKGIAESQYLADDHSLEESVFVNPALMTSTVTANALTHTVYSYAFNFQANEQALKHAIYQNGVIVVGLKLDKNWWTAPNGVISWNAVDLFTNKGFLRLPTDSASIGGHAVVLSGYDEHGFYGPNSFGTTWGDKGFLRIGLDYIPYIYESAALVDLSLVQIQALKDAATAAQQVENTIHSLPPSATTNPQIMALLSQSLTIISSFISRFFNPSLGSPMQSNLFSLNSGDYARGLVVAVGAAVFTSVLTVLGGIINTPNFDVFNVDWGMTGHVMLNVAIIAGFGGFSGYLGKNFVSDKAGAVFGVFAGNK